MPGTPITPDKMEKHMVLDLRFDQASGLKDGRYYLVHKCPRLHVAVFRADERHTWPPFDTTFVAKFEEIASAEAWRTFTSTRTTEEPW